MTEPRHVSLDLELARCIFVVRSIPSHVLMRLAEKSIHAVLIDSELASVVETIRSYIVRELDQSVPSEPPLTPVPRRRGLGPDNSGGCVVFKPGDSGAVDRDLCEPKGRVWREAKKVFGEGDAYTPPSGHCDDEKGHPHR